MPSKLELFYPPFYTTKLNSTTCCHHQKYGALLNKGLVIERSHTQSVMISPFRSCFKLILMVMGVFLFVLYMTSCRWHGQSSFVVETWTDRNRVVHVQLTDRNHYDRFTGPGKDFFPVDVTGGNTVYHETGSNQYDKRFKTSNSGNRGNTLPTVEGDGIVHFSYQPRSDKEIPYKINGVRDEDLIRTLKEIEEERRILSETLKTIKEPDIDFRNVKIYDVTQPIDEDFQCVTIHVRPFTPICVFDPKQDVFVSATLTRGDVWEQHIVKRFQKVLQLHHNICVLDIGANIGQYSLIAANMGHQVLAVEPYLPSLKRFHKAIAKGGLSSKIKALQNAISDKREEVHMKANFDNQANARPYHRFHEDCNQDSCQRVNTIYMNDLMPFFGSQECILKLDIKGYEHRAFAHAELLLDKISVPYIFMDWTKMREFYITERHQSKDKTLVQDMISLLVKKHFTVYSFVSGKKLNVDYWHGWPEDVLWIQEDNVSVRDLEF